MAIMRGNDPAAVIEPGKFILSGSSLNYGICGKPGRVMRLAGQRVYYERLDDADLAGVETHINDEKVKFVCDADTEVNQLLNLSNDAVRTTTAAVQAVEREYRERYANMVDKLLTGV